MNFRYMIAPSSRGQPSPWLRTSLHCCKTLTLYSVRRFSRETVSSKANDKHVGSAANLGEYVCQLRNVGLSIPGGKKLFENVGIGFRRGAKIGIVGANGSGKSSLLKIIAGIGSDYDGERWVKDGLRIGYLQQEPILDPKKNVYDNIMDGLSQCKELMEAFESVTMEMGNDNADLDALMEKQGKVQESIDRLGCWELNFEVEKAMQALRVPPKEADVTTLSGGERRRVALCRLLLEKPDMLLLDEPTNHLDAGSVAWLESFLSSYRGTVLAITHDRYFLDNVAAFILELDRGNAYSHQGNYTTWLEQKTSRLDMEQKTDAARSKVIAKELEWARNHKGGKKANKARLRTMNNRKTEYRPRVEHGQIVIPNGPRLGDKVIKVSRISKTIADTQHTLFKNLSFEIPPRSIVGIVGGNGTGKSTLLRIIAGIERPDSGQIELGKTVSLGFVSQGRDELSNKKTVYEHISQNNEYIELENGERIHTRAYIAAFNLRGYLQERRISTLSGGERNRVHLAKMLLGRHNVILLDEPTNDLDMETLRSLEMALSESFQGTAVVVSHDRYFLDRICTHIIAFEDKGTVRFFESNYSEYESTK